MTVGRRCELLELPRSAYYYKPREKGREVDERREAAMRAIDDIHLEMLYAGARKISKELKKMGFDLGRCATKTLMDEMNVHPLYPKPSLSKPDKGGGAQAPLPAQEQGDPVPKPGLGDRHHLRPFPPKSHDKGT